MPELFFSGRKLKKYWGISLGILAIISLYITHIINIILGISLNKSVSPKPDFSKVNDNLFNFIDVTKSMIDQFSIFTIFLIFFAVLIALSYLMQGILFSDKGYSEADEVGIHGTAKWGNPEELRNGKTFVKHKYSKYNKSLRNNLDMESGYILGKVPEKKNLLIMPDDTDVSNQNVLVVGSPGSGKSQSYVLPNIINVKDKSIIVVDPKGELKTLTGQLKKDQGYEVYQVDFLHFKEAKYNPLYYVENELQAKTIANTMFTNVGQSGNGTDFFKDSATNMLAALIIYVKAEYDIQEANMKKVIDIYNEYVQDEEKFNKWVDTIGKEHPAYYYMIAIKDLTSDTRKSVTATLNTCFDIFKLPEVQEMTSTSDFNFEDFVNDKSILYVKLSMEDDTFAPLTSVFFSQMISIYYDIASESEDNKLKRRIAFYLDEFANIGKIGKYAKTLATCRGLGLSMHTVIQNKAQLEKKTMYGHDEAKEILSTHDTKLILRADRTDTATTEWISKSLGDTTISQKKNDMTKSKGNISKQIGDNYMKRPLMTPEEVASMKDNECLLLVSGYEPLKLEKAFQYNIYPNMLTKKTDKGFEYNYDSIRESLGYTSKLIEPSDYKYTKKLSFTHYRELQQQRNKEKDQIQQQEIEQSEEAQNSKKQEQRNEADKKFNQQYESTGNQENINSLVSSYESGNEEQKAKINSYLNDFNNAFSNESEKANGVSFNNTNEETQSGLVRKATESTHGSLLDMKKQHKNQSKGSHEY